MTRVRPPAAHQSERLLAARQIVAFNADVDHSLLSGVCQRHGLLTLDTVTGEDARDPYTAPGAARGGASGMTTPGSRRPTWAVPTRPPPTAWPCSPCSPAWPADLPAAAAAAAAIHARRAAIKERDPHRRATIRADDEPF